MALTKETVVDRIEVLESNAIQVRSAVRVLEDGEVLSQTYHRHVLQPGDDLSNEDPKVVAIANSIWPSPLSSDPVATDTNEPGEVTV